MKKILNLSLVSLLTLAIFSACSKKDRLAVSDTPVTETNTTAAVDESTWLKQDWGEVVYSDPNYYVVETVYGYTVLKGAAQPSESTILYGDFSQGGSRNFYNSSTSQLVDGDVAKYDLSYESAQRAMDEYSASQEGSAGPAIRKSNSSDVKISRPAK